MALPEPKPKMEHQLRLIKKYPNRRLYDTKTSSYITLADVKQMVHRQEDFHVIDAKSGITGAGRNPTVGSLFAGSGHLARD